MHSGSVLFVNYFYLIPYFPWQRVHGQIYRLFFTECISCFAAAAQLFLTQGLRPGSASRRKTFFQQFSLEEDASNW